MRYIPSTYKILYYRAINSSVNQEWIDWAIEMLQAGHETENLLYFSSFDSSESQFKLLEIIDKAFKELGLDYSDKELVIKSYVNNLVESALLGQLDYYSALNILKGIYYDNDHFRNVGEFNQLYWAKHDLLSYEDTWEWPNAYRDNIDSIIENYFKEWKVQNQIEASQKDFGSNKPNHSSL